MTKKYTFHVEEFDKNGKVVSTKMHTFTTEGDAWSGFDGPMYNFFDFLKGEGFVFHPNDEIGVMHYSKGKESEFRSATRW